MLPGFRFESLKFPRLSVIVDADSPFMVMVARTSASFVCLSVTIPLTERAVCENAAVEQVNSTRGNNNFLIAVFECKK
jgi:hypothetical protein